MHIFFKCTLKDRDSTLIFCTLLIHLNRAPTTASLLLNAISILGQSFFRQLMRIHYYNIIEDIMPIIDKEALLIEEAKSPW
jgi:hypothetical protein